MAKKSAKQQDGGLLAASSWADQMTSAQEDPDRDISSDPPQHTLAFSQPLHSSLHPLGFTQTIADTFQNLMRPEPSARVRSCTFPVHHRGHIRAACTVPARRLLCEPLATAQHCPG